MAFSISGYVLEPIRVGQANSPFTQTPDNYISDQTAFDTAYPSDESEPRNDYLVLITSEGTPIAGLLANAEFGWTKNEVVQRLDYQAAAGRFAPLPGSVVTEAGTLTVDSNVDRITVRPPVRSAPVLGAPYRLAVGSTGSGTTWTVSIVADDSGFGSPPSGTAELSLETGHLNWNTGDLTTYSGQLVRWQQQQFFEFKDSTSIGLIDDDVVLLNPIPGTGQIPLLRFGFGLYLETVEFPTEPLPSPASGTVNWALDTGRLKFNPTDISNYSGTPVYYDGVLYDKGLTLPRQVLGDIAAPAAITGLPPTGVDLIFALPNASPYYQFPQFTYLDSALFSSGKTGVVQVDPSSGAVQFSAADQAKYAGESVTVIFGDLPIERGISVRFLRTPVNLDASQTIKDVTAFYEVTNAVWADPIIASPQVFLPSTPIDDPAYPLVIEIAQGQGTYISSNFPRLDVPSPPTGLGYYIGFDEGVLYFAQRKYQTLVPILQPTTGVALPDPLVLTGNIVLELETGPGTGTYTPLVLGTDALLDPTSGVVSLVTSYPIIVEGVASFSGTTFEDPLADFVSTGIQPGYLIEVSTTAAEGVYTVANVVSATELETDVASPASVTGAAYTIRQNREILADRFFGEVILIDPSTKVQRLRSLGPATNAPRLNIPTAYVTTSGFRFGPAAAAQFATVVLVPTDLDFTSPPAGTVEISEATGNLNFSAADLGTEVFWMRELVIKTDYILQAGLGLIQFTDRMLSLEEILVTYTTEPPSTEPPTDPDPPQQEYGRFLIRKEITQDHPTPTSTLEFNVAGLDVADDPPPAVFRGGRPQELGVQCTVDTAASTITFLPDDHLTDALPHGATIGPDERVYIDYYVTQAVGGEKTITVLNPPILTAVVNIAVIDENGDPNNKFTVHGDHTASFPPDYLLRIENEQVYLIGSSTYNPTTNETTVELYGNQVFQDAFTDPNVFVSSGATPITSAPLAPSYFAAELESFEAIARGSNTFLISGDRTNAYRTGTVLLFTDSGGSFTDFLQVSGTDYDGETNRTEVSLTANAIRQYVSGSQLLFYSVRPIFEPPTTEVQTSRVPVLTEPYTVYRRVEGEPGVILVEPTQFQIDNSGRVIFSEALKAREEFSIFYTGYEVAEAGINLRASYTSQITPNSSNGLLGQILLANYSILSPDSFYYRVETMTNFRGEYAQEIASDASSGSSGPQTENASQPQLFEQGRPSLYFDEKHLANQDIIARSTLLFYNDAVNLLEVYLRALDGRVVGNNDGLLLFDGTTGAEHPPGPVTNQIDDVIKVSDAPYEITFPPFAVTSIGTFQKYYIPGTRSRFYPTDKNFYAVSAVTPTSETGDEVADTGSTNITLVFGLRTRLAWAVVMESTEFSGPALLKVDVAEGSEEYARPPFKTGMECIVQRRDGTYINDSSSPVTVTSVTATTLGITGLAGTADVGTTIYRSPIDGSAQTGPDELIYYLFSRDYSFNGESGQIIYIEEISSISNTPLKEEQALSGKINLINTLTAPEKFPALYGGITDDDGDLSFPIQTPDPDNEQNGFLWTEDQIIHNPTGIIRGLTTSPYVATGTIDGTGTIITNGAGPWPPPPLDPEKYDIARVIAGPDGPSAFARITTVGANTITVDTALGSTPGAVTFEIAVSSITVGGLGMFDPDPTILFDATAIFLSQARVGYTVVYVDPPSANTGERRQIIDIIDNTHVRLDAPLPSTAGGAYRIDNSLATYGGSSNDYLALLNDALTGQLGVYADEQTYILDFLDQVFTDIFTSATGETTVGLKTLDDVNGTFLTSEVSQAHFVYIVAGPNAGIYQVENVLSETQLEVETPFPATQSGISYRIVKLFGVSKATVQALFTLYQSIAALEANTIAFQTLINDPVPVAGVPAAFARPTLTSDLDARDVLVDARLTTDIPATIELIENILANTDKLYDGRYTWIDTRINLKSGLIVQQAIAVDNRIEAQEDFYNQLIKLLAVEEA